MPDRLDRDPAMRLVLGSEIVPGVNRVEISRLNIDPYLATRLRVLNSTRYPKIRCVNKGRIEQQVSRYYPWSTGQNVAKCPRLKV